MTNLEQVQARINAACARSGRTPEGVSLLAVSKTFDAGRVRELALGGQRRFGENYLQEALDKQASLGDLGLEWHFIGPIQSNKTRAIAQAFQWVHSVDRLRIAERLARERSPDRPLMVCVQVNISGEATKSGCTPQEAPALCAAVARLPGLRLRGLMAIPAPAGTGSPNDPAQAYRRLHMLYDALLGQGLALDTLSAGMSGDLEAAIAEGATLVRVGSALFGPRSTRPHSP